MKRKTYNNVLKAGKLIQKKGYSKKESLEIAVQKFDELEQLHNGMSVEWLIEKEREKTAEMEENAPLIGDDEKHPSAENGDYSPVNPWDSPGMSVKDFI